MLRPLIARTLNLRFTMLLCFWCRPAADAAVLYVNDDATGAIDGTSWADAFTDLENVLVGWCRLLARTDEGHRQPPSEHPCTSTRGLALGGCGKLGAEGGQSARSCAFLHIVSTPPDTAAPSDPPSRSPTRILARRGLHPTRQTPTPHQSCSEALRPIGLSRRLCDAKRHIYSITVVFT